MRAPSAETKTAVSVDGVARCTRYAFSPNKLHLCGPDMNEEVLAYMDAGVTDTGLTNILSEFKTLHPYLEQIAHSNGIKNPYDNRVVEAYWLGNELLDAIPAVSFYHHIKENLQLKKKSPAKQFERLKNKIRQGALMHHSFHVLNVWRRTGNTGTEHTLDSLDKCRISWAKVVSVVGPILNIERQQLILEDGKLVLGPLKKERIYRQLEASTILDNIKPKDIVTVHWDLPCEVINLRQVANLKKYTALSIKLANQTI